VRQTYLVPVRESQAGTLALRTGRLVSGERVGLAFTSEASLQLTMGPRQQWVRLATGPLRTMLTPLGVEGIRIDPLPVDGPGPAGSPEPMPAPGQPYRRTTRHRGRDSRRHRPRPRRHAAHGSRRLGDRRRGDQLGLTLIVVPNSAPSQIWRMTPAAATSNTCMVSDCSLASTNALVSMIRTPAASASS
jgi:hypothetical protein